MFNVVLFGDLVKVGVFSSVDGLAFCMIYVIVLLVVLLTVLS